MRRPHPTFFTLVELLVVIAIIAVLASLLLPSLGRARESARQAICVGHLQQMGAMAQMHASDKDGWFPQTLRDNSQGTYTAYGRPAFWRVQGVDPQNDNWQGGTLNSGQWSSGQGNSNWAAIVDSWKHYGTPMQTWQDYGMTNDLLRCPSDDRPNILNEFGIAGWSSGVNTAVETSYTHISGLLRDPRSNKYLTRSVGWSPSPSDSERNHAMYDNQSELNRKVIASCLVVGGYTSSFPNYTGGGVTWGEWSVKPDPTLVNHGDNYTVLAQPILFGDGHVEVEKDYYRGGLVGKEAQYRRNFSGSTGYHLHFWGTGN
jgi:prepilin-type N-terminal cleavage/methylation domain-containing protein